MNKKPRQNPERRVVNHFAAILGPERTAAFHEETARQLGVAAVLKSQPVEGSAERIAIVLRRSVEEINQTEIV
jgi:hypothetical protein